MKIAIILIAAVMLAGCPSSGTSTTQPAVLVNQTTALASAVTLAENAIQLSLQLHIISGSTYWSKIDPALTAANAGLVAMQKDVAAGNTSAATADQDAALAALAQIQTYTTPPTTQGTK